jgi:hypothetical protein
MHDNVGARDCAVRFAIGLAFVFATLILGEGAGRWLALLGLLPMASAIFGYCPAYALLGLDTVRRPPGYP